MFLLEWLRNEAEAAVVIIGGLIILGIGLSIGDFFTAIGDKLFEQSKEDA